MNKQQPTINILFNGRFPSEKAASLFAAKSAEEFANLGVSVRLIVPKRWGTMKTSAHAFYGLKDNFTVVYLPIIDFFLFPLPKKVAFYLVYSMFSFVSFLYMLIRAERYDIVFSNELLPLVVASSYFPNTFYEMHDFPESKLSLFAWSVKRLRWILIHNRWKKEQFCKLFAHKTGNILMVPNAVDIEQFDLPISKREAREKLGLPLDAHIVVYTGHLYGWKGVDTLVEAMNKSPRITCYLVGGTLEDVAKYQHKTVGQQNIIFVGYRNHTEIPLWQKAADCLVIPNTAKEDISKYYTSPMKLFEYMASERPIVASRIPSIREIVNENHVLFAEPDNAKSLKDSIEKAIFENQEKMIKSAREEVETYTWKKRQQAILHFIQH